MFTHRFYISLEMLLQNFYRKQSAIMPLNGCSNPGETFSSIKAAVLLPRPLVDSDVSASKTIHLLIEHPSVHPFVRQTPGRNRVLLGRLVGGLEPLMLGF